MRAPRGSNETAELDNAVDRHAAEVDHARWCFETEAWERGGNVGPRPRPPIPPPGNLIYL